MEDIRSGASRLETEAPVLEFAKLGQKLSEELVLGRGIPRPNFGLITQEILA